MDTLSFQAPAEMHKQLEAMAKELDRSKAYIIRQALAEYLEDLQDVSQARRAQASYGPSELVSLDEVKHRFNLI